jgi:hypothetical protein
MAGLDAWLDHATATQAAAAAAYLASVAGTLPQVSPSLLAAATTTMFKGALFFSGRVGSSLGSFEAIGLLCLFRFGYVKGAVFRRFFLEFKRARAAGLITRKVCRRNAYELHI